MFRQKFLASASIIFLGSILPATAQIASQSGPETVTVTAEALEQARAGIQTQIGASTYTVTAEDIQNQPGGDNSAAQFGDPADAGRGAGFLRPAPYPRRA